MVEFQSIRAGARFSGNHASRLQTSRSETSTNT
jgi:hypothetical protein